MRPFVNRLALVLALVLAALPAEAGAEVSVRVKDLGYFDGVRPNQLIGYGLVVGLDGTGDTERTTFTPQSLEAMLSRLGVRFDRQQLVLRNVAAVTVTAELPAFSRPGARIDVQVSSIGDARSLNNGTLLMTPLIGADNQTYAVAQGRLAVGREADRDDVFRSFRFRVNVGRIQGGGLVEREVPVVLADAGRLTYLLRRPDFQTAANIAARINERQPGQEPPPPAPQPVRLRRGETPPPPPPAPPALPPIAFVRDAGVVEIRLDPAWQDRVSEAIAHIEGLEVLTDDIARVVVSASTGTVVMGGDVRLSQVAIAWGGLTLRIGDGIFADPTRGAGAAPPRPGAAGAPPAGGAAGDTPLNPAAAGPTGGAGPGAGANGSAEPGPLKLVEEGATLSEVVRGLNTLGVTGPELVDILETLAASGGLYARLEIIP
jgi:flagellar P-ring protein precursor FlgI